MRRWCVRVTACVREPGAGTRSAASGGTDLLFANFVVCSRLQVDAFASENHIHLFFSRLVRIFAELKYKSLQTTVYNKIMEKRVVVTGLGAVTPIGHNVASYWKNLLDGVCGIDFIKSFPTDDLPSKVAAEVKDFDPVALGLDLPFVRKQDRFTVFATIAAEEALRLSGLKAAKEGEEGGRGYQPKGRGTVVRALSDRSCG